MSSPHKTLWTIRNTKRKKQQQQQPKPFKKKKVKSKKHTTAKMLNIVLIAKNFQEITNSQNYFFLNIFGKVFI